MGEGKDKEFRRDRDTEDRGELKIRRMGERKGYGG